jgi:hypothetical protein
VTDQLNAKTSSHNVSPDYDNGVWLGPCIENSSFRFCIVTHCSEWPKTGIALQILVKISVIKKKLSKQFKCTLNIRRSFIRWTRTKKNSKYLAEMPYEQIKFRKFPAETLRHGLHKTQGYHTNNAEHTNSCLMSTGFNLYFPQLKVDQHAVLTYSNYNILEWIANCSRPFAAAYSIEAALPSVGEEINHS